MADQVTNFSALSNDAAAYWITQQQYRLSERQMVLGKFATSFKLPERMGKTLRVTRHKRLSVPNAPLSEGVPPDAVALAVENVDVTVEQWGIVCLLTDVAMVTPTHPALQIANERVSMAMSEMFEREIGKTLLSGTSVYYAGTGNAARADLTATDVVDTALILKITTSLRNRGAATYEGGLYGGVLAPNQEADVLAADQTFKDAQSFAGNIRKLEYGEIGVWMAVRWGRGNFLPAFKGVGAPGTQTSEVSGFSEAGAGGAYGNSAIRVVAKDAQSGMERKISQNKLTAAGSDSATITTPTSTNYVYDIYSDGDNGGGTGTFRRLYANVAANTANPINPSVYAAGELLAPPAAPASGIEVFTAFVFGKDAFGRVELNGMSLQSYITPPGPSWSNPLAQGRKVGSKVMWKTFILENSFFSRIESGSAYSAEFPA